MRTHFASCFGAAGRVAGALDSSIRCLCAAAAGALLLATSGSVALETARMELPPDFEAGAERLSATGFGGRNRGRYALGAYEGEFTRIESRWAVFDPLVATSRGKSSFTLEGPGFEASVSGTCEMKQRTVTVGVISFDPKKMIYECSFLRGQSGMDASFVLGQPKPASFRARLLARSDRRGEAVVEGVRLGIRSAHKYAGSKFQAATPVGYFLEIDDRPVGAIELTDVNPTFFLPAEETVETRRAVLIAALSLSVLRDPAESDLGD